MGWDDMRQARVGAPDGAEEGSTAGAAAGRRCEDSRGAGLWPMGASLRPRIRSAFRVGWGWATGSARGAVADCSVAVCVPVRVMLVCGGAPAQGTASGRRERH